MAKKSKKPEIKSSPIMSRVKAHYDDLGTRTLEVPEWGDEEGKPLIIYCSPMTLKQKNLIVRSAKNDYDMSMFVNALIRKALDGQGDHLFTLADRPTLMEKSDGAVIERVALWILHGDHEEDEEEAGND